MASSAPTSGIDISKITGPYQVFGGFLIVAEALLTLMLTKAESEGERIFIGVIMLIILLAFLIALVFLTVKTQQPQQSVSGLPKPLEPGKEEATKAQIAAPQSEQKAGPDGTYLINRPPEGWVLAQMTGLDFQAAALHISDPAIKEKLRTQLPIFTTADMEILTFESKRVTSIIPLPGQSMFNHRKLASALEVTIPTRLAIFPMQRALPPFYIERPLEHNVFQSAAEFLASNVMTIQSVKLGTTQGSQRKQMTVEFRQDIENVLVNGALVDEVQSHMTMIGIEGIAQDYLLIMNYASSRDTDDQWKTDLETLNALVNSFKPLKDDEAQTKLQELNHLGELTYQRIIDEHGQAVFDAELTTLLLRFKGLNLDDPNSRQQAITLLRPFEAFAREVKLNDDTINALFVSMHEAEKGNAQAFKDQFAQLIERAVASFNNTQAQQLPPAPDDVPAAS